MIECEFCGAPNPEERIACRECGNPVRRPPPPSLVTSNDESASDYFALDRAGLSDSPDEERQALAKVRAAIQESDRDKKWWRRK
jgi:hypothetical protein